MDRACKKHGRLQDAFKITDRKPEGKRPLGRPRIIQEDNIKINLKEKGCEVWMDSFGSGRVQWWALVNMVTSFWVQ
jgi:hypothetical protein